MGSWYNSPFTSCLNKTCCLLLEQKKPSCPQRFGLKSYIYLQLKDFHPGKCTQGLPGDPNSQDHSLTQPMSLFVLAGKSCSRTDRNWIQQGLIIPHSHLCGKGTAFLRAWHTQRLKHTLKVHDVHQSACPLLTRIYLYLWSRLQKSVWTSLFSSDLHLCSWCLAGPVLISQSVQIHLRYCLLLEDVEMMLQVSSGPYRMPLPVWSWSRSVHPTKDMVIIPGQRLKGQGRLYLQSSPC